MKHFQLFYIYCFFLTLSCSSNNDVLKEKWTSKPLNEWPDIAMTNEICFSDTSYHDMANSFLVNTGKDTIGVSCKHWFLLFQRDMNMQNIHLGEQFKSWTFYPKNKPKKRIDCKRLISMDKNEIIGNFNTLKTRDWLIFEMEKSKDIYPLKIRHTPVRKGETIYSLGWSHKQENSSPPKLIKLKCTQNVGPYFYTQIVSQNVSSPGRSGSPVIDSNGYLVGIASGAEGNQGVQGSVLYLIELLNKYGIKCNRPNN